MQHLLFEGPGKLSWQETETPVIENDRDALVRPIAVARCDLDSAIAMGLYPMKPPFTMGHEIVGEIVEVGDSAGDWKPGDKVIVPFQISYRTVAGPLAKNPGAPVLVVGGLAKSVGLYAAASAVALGSERVVYVDFDEGRSEMARSFGAEAINLTFDELVEFSWEERFPITVDACVLPPGRDLAIRSVTPCGHCTSVSGGPLPTAEFPLPGMYAKGITYEVSRVHARATAPAVIDLVEQGKLDPGALISKTLPFSEAAEAMPDDAVKIVFTR